RGRDRTPCRGGTGVRGRDRRRLPRARRGPSRRPPADRPCRRRGRQLDRATDRLRSVAAGGRAARMPPLRVLVTRPREQAPPLVDALESRGFDVVVEPLIRIEALSDDPIDVHGYDCVIVTSPNGVRELARRMSERPAM